MGYRRKMSRKQSKRSFRKGAMNVKGKNYRTSPMRGGTRL